MSTETTEAPAVAPAADPSPAGNQTSAGDSSAETRQETGEPGETKPEAAEKPAEEPKKEKTPEEKRIAQMQRRIDNLTRRYHETRAQLEHGQNLQRPPIDGTNRGQEADSEPLSLSRTELQRLVEQEARRLAPTISEQQAAIEHRRGVVEKLSSSLGQERFDALASDLDDAFDGLKDAQGRAKPAADAIFDAEDPQALIEYLADPDNAAESAALSRMGPLQAGRAIAKLELKLAAKKAETKPQPSKATPPIEPLKGAGGTASKQIWDLEGADFDKARREYIKRYRS